MVKLNDLSLTPNLLQADIARHLTFTLGKDAPNASVDDWRMALSFAIRDRIVEPLFASTRRTWAEDRKRVYYLSLEFLIGRLLRDAISNLDRTDDFTDALAAHNVDIEQIEALEPDAALGNGGLGRLAACFMESMASLDIPAYGYGIRYNHGLFRQKITDGWQVELPENWLEHGNAWEFPRREAAYEIGFGGQVTPGVDIRQPPPAPLEACREAHCLGL